MPPLRAVIARDGLAARRALGQHFLTDINLTARIARAAEPLAGRTVIEIGPGPGGLTRALLAAGAERLIAVERARRFAPALAEIAAAWPGRLEVVWADALAVDAAGLGAPPRKIVANLPYNIATPLLLAWLRRLAAFESLTLMLQKEVALKLTAAPGGRDYGRLGVAMQWRAHGRRLFDVPARAFVPPPRVTSTVLEIRPRPAPLCEADAGLMEEVTAAAFGQRRRMLRQSLRALGVDTAALIARADVAETARAEELDVPAFCRLAQALAALRAGR
ncbi:MAG: 16S rRNA (adenine(1518)-N(6)/adenine(1519)-N(6))-dimethyltransferase RsmA [Rhodospirillaceae bacterium]|nr:16S rRNA (adenine(1518)-N(6)/adenine(1519)-N(6))-dimethyltransferase RsmA [Rhodospirillaceae bacterium]